MMTRSKKEKMSQVKGGVGLVEKDINKSHLQCSVSNISFVLGALEMRLKFEYEDGENPHYEDFVQGTVTGVSEGRSVVANDCPDCGEKGRQTVLHVTVTAVSRCSCIVSGDKSVTDTGDSRADEQRCCGAVSGEENVDTRDASQDDGGMWAMKGLPVVHVLNETADGDRTFSPTVSGCRKQCSGAGNRNRTSDSVDTLNMEKGNVQSSVSDRVRRGGRKRPARKNDDTNLTALCSLTDQAVSRSKCPRTLPPTRRTKKRENPESVNLYNKSDDIPCSMCDNVFKAKLELTKHMKSVHVEKCYNGDSGEQSCDDSQARRLHRSVHDGGQPCQRDMCEKTNMATTRRTKHTADKSFKCDQCGKCFHLRTQLQAHLSVHTGDRPFTCGLCGKPFVSRLHLHKHMKLHLGGKRHTCDLCPKAFLSAKDLEYHRTKHTGDKKFKCDACGSTFTVKASLKKHLLLHRDVKPFKCGCCQKDFASIGQLQKHSKIHNTLNPLVCEICGKTFPTNNYLQSHRKTHIGYEKYGCEVCGKSYREAAYLKIHMKSHTGEGLLKCDLCWENFADPSYLKVHKRRFCRSKTVQCEECGREFVNQRDLRLHRGVHSGERPHECRVCGKGFLKADALSEHARRHDDSLKTHKCDICSKGYVCASDLRKHKKTHNKVKHRIQLPDKFKYDLEKSCMEVSPVETQGVTAEISKHPNLSLEVSDIQIISLPAEVEAEDPETQIREEYCHGNMDEEKPSKDTLASVNTSEKDLVKRESGENSGLQQSSSQGASGADELVKAEEDIVSAQANDNLVKTKAGKDQVTAQGGKDLVNVRVSESQVTTQGGKDLVNVRANGCQVNAQVREDHLNEEDESDTSATERSKEESEDMLLDTASISSPIHLDSLDPNSSLENALNALMSDTDQLLTNVYYKLNLPGRSPT